MLAVAGSDSGAGAGIQADLKTCAALGVYAATVVTAVTAQNTLGVRHVEPVSRASVEAQLNAVFDDFNVAAVKIGLVPNRALADVIGQVLRARAPHYVVLDPVGTASAGGEMADRDAAAALTEHLFPLATVLTPNVNEALTLTGLVDSPRDEESTLLAAGRALLALGPAYVLLKGGHRPTQEAVDILLSVASSERRYRGARLNVHNDHGTGCTLSSAIAAQLALGATVEEAVETAKRYVTGALSRADALTLGSGPGPLDHFFGSNGG